MRDFRQAMERLLGERLSEIEALIVIRPKGNHIIVVIQAKAVKLLGLGIRRRTFKGSSKVVIREIAREMAMA